MGDKCKGTVLKSRGDLRQKTICNCYNNLKTVENTGVFDGVTVVTKIRDVHAILRHEKIIVPVCMSKNGYRGYKCL